VGGIPVGVISWALFLMGVIPGGRYSAPPPSFGGSAYAFIIGMSAIFYVNQNYINGCCFVNLYEIYIY
jgi:hypothetical protein